MQYQIYKEKLQTEHIKKFDNEFFLFKDGKEKPFAFRAYDVEDPVIPVAKIDKPLIEIGAFSIYNVDNALYCLYHGAQRIAACISPFGADGLNGSMLRSLERYFQNSYRLDLYAVSLRTAFEGFEELVAAAAEFCGCLTDILRDDSESSFLSQYAFSVDNTGCEHIAVALPIVSLMFRRISALRGFNFKVTVKDSLPCLIFSAKVLPGECNDFHDLRDIREYSALTDILGDDGLIVDAKIRETDDVGDNNEKLLRLSLVICPQTVDPRGILRAPAWRQQTQKTIEALDTDLDGKY